ncbi:hypothetical protein QFC21_002859 [Naganishia friedmannii]|uniref:Uncharacterized protein n=1 Tax=Naganishia friedmannii TaxID=89922 RepID=A0ACC2VSS1_9TREE|nr:hypothetical protein QFC21_002859 [Naganishia friedmannii]
MSGFPPSYMYGLPPLSTMDPTMYHTMPPPLPAAGMMGYPSYGVFPPGYMPPSWPLAQIPALPGQDLQLHAQAYLPNQSVPRVPSYSETHTSHRPPPIAVPEWPVSRVDGNGNAGGGVQEASALTPKPMLQNGSANMDTWEEHYRQNQGVSSNAAPYQDNSSQSMHLAAQPNEGRNQAMSHDGHQTSRPLSSMRNDSTTRKARGMEYLRSLGVTDNTPTDDTVSEEASVIEIWPPDSYDQLTFDSNTDQNAISGPMQSTTSLLQDTHITPQVGPDPIFNHSQSQAHRESTVSIPNTIQSVDEGPSHSYERLARVSSVAPSWISQAREGGRPPARWVQNKLFLHQSHAEGREAGGEFDPESAADSYWDDDMDDDGMYRDEADGSEEEENEMNFFMPSLESHVAVQWRDRVERNTHIKGGIAWPASFTGRDVVTVIQSLMPDWTRTSSNDRRFALSVARSLHKQLFFVEVDWDDKPLRDAMEGVYQFNEIDGAGAIAYELPTGVQIMVTKCYSPSCVADKGCYSSRCPYNISPDAYLKIERKASMATINTVNIQEQERERIQNSLDESLLSTLSESERKRQLLSPLSIIHQAVIAEEQYKADLEALETLYISPLRLADPPVIRSLKDLEELINGIFGNIIELREANARILEFFLIRKREEGGLLTTVGDIFLSAAADFRNLYPEYIGGLPKAEERLKIELNQNSNFRAFVETVRQNARRDFDHRRMDLKHLMTRPSTQLNRYPPILEAILAETPADSPDALFLSEAIKAIRNLTFAAQLKLWQGTTGRTEHVPNADPLLKKEAKDQSGDKDWHEFVSKEDLEVMTEKERKLQEWVLTLLIQEMLGTNVLSRQIWELIKSEMQYVADLRAIDNVSGQSHAPRNTAEVFVDGLRMADEPIVDRFRLPEFEADVFHNFGSLRMIHEELLRNLHARQEEQHPRMGPISDLIYDAALQWGDAYQEYASNLPKALFAIDEEKKNNPKFTAFLEKCISTPGTNRQGFQHFINRPVHKLPRLKMQLESVLSTLEKLELYDHTDTITLPQVVELISIQGKSINKAVKEMEPKVRLRSLPNQLFGGKFGESSIKSLDLLNPSRELIHEGKLYRHSDTTLNTTWSELSAFLLDNYFVLCKTDKSSKVTSSGIAKHYINRRPVPVELIVLNSFENTGQTRAVGFLKGIRGDRHETSAGGRDAPDSRTVYPFSYTIIGSGSAAGQYTLWADSEQSRQEWKEKFQHAQALRRAEIEANTTLLAYPLEALVPSLNPAAPVPRGHQKLSDKHEVQYFTCGNISGRTLVIYLRKKGVSWRMPSKLYELVDAEMISQLDSVFKCLEPVSGKDSDEGRNRRPFGNLMLNAKSDWFRVYKDFGISAEAYNVTFLRSRIILSCSKGFQIMDLAQSSSAEFPVFDNAKLKSDSNLAALRERCNNGARPLGIFRATENEFLLCYDTFSFYATRQGYPCRDLRPIDFEGRPETAAFHPPYLLLFSASFIEIRHISDCRLIQIVNAKDVKCTWQCSDTTTLPIPGPDGYDERRMPMESRVHIAKRSDVRDGRKRGTAVGIDVFELCPTSILNNPAREPNNDSMYFPPAPSVQYAVGIATALKSVKQNRVPTDTVTQARSAAAKQK